MADYEDIVAFFSGLAESASRGSEAAQRRGERKRYEERGTASLLMSIRNMLGREKGEEFRRSLAQAGEERDIASHGAKMKGYETQATLDEAKLGEIEKKRQYDQALAGGYEPEEEPELRKGAIAVGYTPEEVRELFGEREDYPGQFAAQKGSVEALTKYRETGTQTRIQTQKLKEWDTLYDNKLEEIATFGKVNWMSIAQNESDKKEGKPPSYKHVDAQLQKLYRELRDLDEKRGTMLGEAEGSVADFLSAPAESRGASGSWGQPSLGEGESVPQDFINEQQKLQGYLRSGQISQEQYNLAVQELYKDYGWGGD